MKALIRIGLLISLAYITVGCQSAPGRSLQTELTLYRVKSGDSLQSIAWHYALNAEDIAGWNKLKRPGTVFPGQLIRLSPPPGYQHKYSESSRKVAKSSFPQEKKQPHSTSPGTPYTPAEPVRIPPPPPAAPVVKPSAQPSHRYQTPSQPTYSQLAELAWVWPTNGKVVSGYQGGSTGHSGIQIAGVTGQDIYAAEGGTVVYSGSGLKGYKEMIIIEHPGNYLTAYAYNQRRFVMENERVTRGQKIAEMGSDDDKSVLLFEIRHNGKPVNPMSYLPKS